MAKVRVMVWNVQNFGSLGDSYVNYKGTDSLLLAQFMADVVRAYGIDVLMVMEVMRSAEPSLDNVMYALNAGLAAPAWCYDSVRGAVSAEQNVIPPVNILSKDQLSWASSAVSPRAEGYAVFWRDDQRDRFTMKPAGRNVSEGRWIQNGYAPPQAPPSHVIEPSLKGRAAIDIKPPPGVQSDAGFSPAAPGVGWGWSEYPDVTALLTARPRWRGARRPACATIELAIGGNRAAKTVPILAYHAPSRLGLARMGTYLSGLAQELYVLDDLSYHPKAIAGGDYNVDTRSVDADHPGAWSVAYRKYVQPFSPGLPPLDAWDAGAAMTAFNTDTHGGATIIKLRESVNGKPIGAPILKPNLSFYASRPIDNVFHRGLTGAVASLATLPQTVMQGGLFNGASLQRWFEHLVTVAFGAATIDEATGPMNPTGPQGALRPVFPNMTDWAGFMAGIQRGWFLGNPSTGVGDARSAAVFVHDFVSDHLPLIVEFDVA